jgi:hypothetical protein
MDRLFSMRTASCTVSTLYPGDEEGATGAGASGVPWRIRVWQITVEDSFGTKEFHRKKRKIVSNFMGKT